MGVVTSGIHSSFHTISCKPYKSLSLLQCDNKVRHVPLGWLQYMHWAPSDTRRCRCIMNLLFNTYQLGKKWCTLCHDYKKDSIDHILFVCTNEDIVRIRTGLWFNVLGACQGMLSDEICRMNIDDRTKFLLNAFHCEFVVEWTPLYREVSNFIYTRA